MKKVLYLLGLAFTLSIVSGSFTEVTAQKTKEVHKKGWSHKKKYTVIGAGAGAVTGAAVSKKRAKGAIIGGAAGAGAGYILGRHRDKKDPARKKIYKYKTAS